MDDRELTKDLLNMINERNILLKQLLKGFVAIIIAVVISLSLVIATVSISYNNAIKECTRIYFETPYDYPSMTQEQNVEVR